MPAFRTSGSTGLAPVTSFMGAVPDRLTMLQPGFVDSAGELHWTFQIPALNVNQWISYNTVNFGGANQNTVSLGALTTAPDGTNTAQKIIEDTSNAPHSMLATMVDSIFPGGYALRLAAFANAVERTRICLQLNDNHFNNVCSTVYDLAGGQIGVGNTAASASGWTAGPAQITPFGNGWYLCWMDVVIPTDAFVGGFRWLFANLFIDAGSGTAARNTTYTGTGTSGVNVWKASLLPARAWSLNSTAYFNDFTSLASIDTGFTSAPGFDFYPNLVWPNPEFTLGSIGSDPVFSIRSGTILDAVGDTRNGLMYSAVYNGAGGFNGNRVFKLPVLIEASWGFDMSGYDHSGGDPTFWTTSIERLLSSAPDVGTPGNVQPAQIELDPFETAPGVFPKYTLNESYDYGPNGATMFTSVTTSGYPLWIANQSYSNTFVVGYPTTGIGTTLYQAQTTTTPGHAPPSFPAEWSVFTPNTANHIPNTAGSLTYDLGALNTVSYLWFPYTLAEQGFVITFFNGLISRTFAYGAVNSAAFGPRGGGFHIADGNTIPILFGGWNTTYKTSIDWVRVTQ
jgi:hypothetical protein